MNLAASHHKGRENSAISTVKALTWQSRQRLDFIFRDEKQIKDGKERSNDDRMSNSQ